MDHGLYGTAELVAGFERVASLIDGARSVALAGHTNPDGDALGSVLALARAIRTRWPHVAVHTVLADDAPVPACYRFLPGAQGFVPASTFVEDVDVFIGVDTPTRERLKDAADVMDRAGAVACIDHHPAREPYAAQPCVVEAAASAGDVVYEFLRFLQAPLDVETATCLLCAVMTDTGRFQYQNADPHALGVSGACIAAGASCADVASAVYQADSLAALHLRARVLDRVAVDEASRTAYAHVTLEDLALTGAQRDDCEGLVDEVRRLGGVDAVLFLRENALGEVRGNLRAKADWLDVAAVARAFGGGGHRAAAGFTFEGSVEDARAAALEALRRQASTTRPADAGEGRR